MTNIIKYITICLVVVMLQGSAAQSNYRITKGTISFKSDAPLEMIKAYSTEVQGIFIPAKKGFAFRVGVQSFKGFNGPLQKEHFNENYMESVRFPYAMFEGKIIEDISLENNTTATIRAKGNLTVHGVSQERIIKCDINIKNNTIFIRSNFSVMLADHNITIPKVVHEKLASEIKVDINAEMNLQ